MLETNAMDAIQVGETLEVDTLISTPMASSKLSATTTGTSSFHIGGRDYTACLIAIATACLFADQNLMAPNLSQIAKEFGMTPLEADQKLGGEIALSLFVVGGPISLIVGVLADKLNRRKLYTAVILFGEIGCFLTVLVTGYWHLFFLRALTGISLGGALPLVFSMLSDMYPPSERNRVSAVIGVSMSLGTLLGQLLSGAVGPTYGWRLPFVLVAAPSCLVAIVFYLTAMDPVRASQEGNGDDNGSHAAYSEKVSWQKIKQIFMSKSNRIIFIQGIPGCTPWGMISVFLNDYLYTDNGAPSVLDATTILTIYGVGGLFGQLFGGYWGQKLYNRRKENVAILMGVSTILAIFPLLLILNLPFSYVSLIPIAFIGGACASITGGTVFALFSLTDDLGKAFGPYLLSAFVGVLGRRRAFNIATSGWLLAGIGLGSLAFTMREDEEKVTNKVISVKTKMCRGSFLDKQSSEKKKTSVSIQLGHMKKSKREGSIDSDHQPKQISKTRFV